MENEFAVGDIVVLNNEKVFGLGDCDREILLQIDVLEIGGNYRVDFLDPTDKLYLLSKGIIGSADDDVVATPGCLLRYDDDLLNDIDLDELFD